LRLEIVDEDAFVRTVEIVDCCGRVDDDPMMVKERGGAPVKMVCRHFVGVALRLWQ
jgi:hypothetical protein